MINLLLKIKKRVTLKTGVELELRTDSTSVCKMKSHVEFSITLVLHPKSPTPTPIGEKNLHLCLGSFDSCSHINTM